MYKFYKKNSEEEMTANSNEDPILAIGYEKYLNCSKCKEVEPYCPEHKSEVEVLLSRLNAK